MPMIFFWNSSRFATGLTSNSTVIVFYFQDIYICMFAWILVDSISYNIDDLEVFIRSLPLNRFL